MCLSCSLRRRRNEKGWASCSRSCASWWRQSMACSGALRGVRTYFLAKSYHCCFAAHTARRSLMLTVLKNNADAVAFYTRQGFTVDGSSPSAHGEEAPYEILSKAVRAPSAAAPALDMD